MARLCAWLFLSLFEQECVAFVREPRAPGMYVRPSIATFTGPIYE